MSKVLINVILFLSLISVSCVTYDSNFSSKTVINDDGTATRSGEMKISLSGDREASEDSAKAIEFYLKHFEPLESENYSISQSFTDSSLIVSWSTEFTLGETLSDYKHVSDSGIIADNNFSFSEIDRWIYKVFIYEEIYSDPIDTTLLYPILDSLLIDASLDIMDSDPLKAIQTPELAESLLYSFQENLGRDLLRIFVSNSSAIDTLTAKFEAEIEIISDSIAGMAGVKDNPQTLNESINDIYSSAWDTLYSKHPEVFGSYGIEINQNHNFEIEVEFPGCIVSSNADTVIDNTAMWKFDHYQFSGNEYKLELKARKWKWLNVAISVICILVLFGIVLRPKRKK